MSPVKEETVTTIHNRQEAKAWQEKWDAKAPRVGDESPDFAIVNAEGDGGVCLSQFRNKRPVVLVFGSFT